MNHLDDRPSDALRRFSFTLGPAPAHRRDRPVKIAVRDLDFWYGEQQALFDVTLDIFDRETLALIGPSGCGKSTLLRLIADVLPPTTGSLTIGDSTPDAARKRHEIGFVFQDPTLLPWRRALDNITIAAGCDAAVGRDLMAQVGLAGREDQFPRQMSLGQQRRLALARAFAARPDILLMDEPFASLDPETATRMIRLAAGLLDRSGAGLFLVTHDAGEPARLEAQVFRLSGHPAVLQRDRD